MMYRDIAWLCRLAKAAPCADGGKISKPMDTTAGQRLLRLLAIEIFAYLLLVC